MALEELAQEMVGVLVPTAQQTEEVEVVVANQVKWGPKVEVVVVEL